MGMPRRIIKKVYSGIPESGKHFLLSVIRSVYTPSKRLQSFLTFNDSFTVKLGAGKKFHIWHTGKWIENDLFWKGIDGYEKVSMKLWMQAAQYAQVVFDVGANTGVFSLVAQSMNDKATVVAFEPFPRFFNLLKKNILLNRYNIVAEMKAISDNNGNAEFYFPEEGTGNIYSASLSSTHYNIHNSSESSKILVDVCNLKTYIETAGIKRIDLLKIDAEGNDIKVLKGMGDYIQKFWPDILVEVHSDETGKEIQDLLKGVDYVFYNIDEKDEPVYEKSIRKSAGLNYFICKRETAKRLNLSLPA